jgi:hypothetical protein
MIPILIGTGAIAVGGWIYHHLLISKVNARVDALENKGHGH